MRLASEDGTAAWSAAARHDFEAIARRRELLLRRDEPLARHTSFGVGGPCPLMVYPANPDGIRELGRWAGSRGLPLRILSGGTNLLVGDSGVSEPVLNLTRLTERDDSPAVFPAGLPSAQVLHQTVAAGQRGFVWAAGLPGTIGGAAAGNAGCWGGDMQGSVAHLDLIDRLGASHRLDADALSWSYRTLEIHDVAAPWIIVGVGLRLEPADPEALRARYEDLQARKRETQPVGERNSGCIFRNPEGRSAGAILDASGCKGLRVGGARVSERHANFIVNDGSATAADVRELIDQLVVRAREEAGVQLRPEVRRW